MGATLWFTGLPSAGKTTLACAVAQRLAGRVQVQLLDGDAVRQALGGDLGFSRSDRELNIARLGYIASLLASHEVVSLVAAIAPYSSARENVRQSHAQAGVKYYEIYVATPLDVCRQRDVKGLYAQQAAGSLSGLTGVDDIYEPPRSPDLIIDTSHVELDAAVEQVLRLLEEGSTW